MTTAFFQEVPNSNLDQGIDYPHLHFSWTFPVPIEKCRGCASNQLTTVSLHFLSNSLFTNHLTIRLYIIRTTN
jgi:hypothetical protein